MAKDDIHGLAATIQSSTSSETFDLGGLPATTITQVISDAFSRDFELSPGEMIRITLVVGAGKGNRSKYDPAALKLVTTSLGAAGYVEDRGASCVVESAGCFKFQHDTGKNLKTVVVFPKIAKESGTSAESSPQSSSLLPPNSLEFKIAVSTLPLFTNMLKFKFPLWSQKRSLLKLMDENLVGPLEKLDATLIRGGLLSEDESMMYEQCVSVSEKKALVKDGMSQQVQDGNLTSSEVSFLLDQLATRMEELQSSKKAVPNALRERQTKLQSIAKNPMAPLPLKHHAELGKLWKQAAPLMYLQASGGKLLSPAETKKRGQLDDILNEIAELEESSRGLLEDDESYTERIQSYRRELQQKYGKLGTEKGGQKKNRTVGIGGSSSTSKKQSAWNSTTKFHTPNVGTRGGGAWMSGKKKKSKGKSVDVFGAMMADSDSDSDEDESFDNRNATSLEVDVNGGQNDQPSNVQTTNRGANNGGSKKKKKKKKGKSKTTGRQDDDDTILDAAIAANNGGTKNEKEAQIARKADDGFDIISLFSVAVTDWIIPMVMAIFVWLAGFLFGKSKNKRKKK